MKKLLWASLLLVGGVVQAEEPSARTITETFKDWQINCVERGGQKACEMKQTLVNGNQQVVAVLSLAKQSKSGNVMQIVLPHLVDLTVPVELSIDGEKATKLPYNFCNQTGCFVQIKNDTPFINKFKKGQSASIKSLTLGGDSLDLNISLNGFSQAYKSLPVNNLLN